MWVTVLIGCFLVFFCNFLSLERIYLEHRRASLLRSSRSRKPLIFESSISCASGKRLVAMTNSTPKIVDKVRHGSPNTGGKPHRNRSNSIKSATFYNTGGKKQTNRRHSFSVPYVMKKDSPMVIAATKSASKIMPATITEAEIVTNIEIFTPISQQKTSSRSESPGSSGQNNRNFAAGKWSEPPSPESLPKPPTHWTASEFMTCHQAEMRLQSNHLMMVLKVQA